MPNPSELVQRLNSIHGTILYQLHPQKLHPSISDDKKEVHEPLYIQRELIDEDEYDHQY